MGEIVKSLFFALLLAIVAGISAGTLVVGVVTGSIPTKSTGVVAFSSQPVLFSFVALFYLIVAIGLAIAAYKLLRGAPV